MENILYWLGGTLIQWACSVAVGLPFVVVAVGAARRRGQDVSAGRLVLLAVFFFVSLALTRLSSVWSFIKSPWQAMTLEAVFALAVIFATRSASSAGLTLRIPAHAWRDSAIATGLLLLFVIGRSLSIRLLGIGSMGTGGTGRIPLEFLLYQLTMPGIAEELSYRGVIQPGLNEPFGRPQRLLGAQVGWGWVITSLVFWAPHAFRVDPQMHLSFYWPTLTMQLIAGFVFGWMRERTESVFPPMIAHNLVNVVWTLF
ncbi:MAG: CPBP family intramembrane metalloprotease [Chloroflexi bacterium]|nr:CPBP family intramembrane metalloprotease [Chloroflexota bacterium]